MKIEYKVGDWCFHNFELVQILEMEEGNITEVSTGVIRTSSSSLNDRCFPLDLGIKNISSTTKYWYDKLHSSDNRSLNYPDIVRELERLWAGVCDIYIKEGKESSRLEEANSKIAIFAKKIIEQVENTRDIYVEGVRIFSR